MLRRRGVAHQVLNAKQHEKEALVVAQAGRPGTVTIATNMAGRGVDILLGGKPDGLARESLRKQGHDLTEVPESVWQDALDKAREVCSTDRQRVLEQGGLHVIGTERHEARRIDNQLRGRAGRQGDPGSSRFYVSLEDDLMRRFGGSMVAGLMDRLGVDEDIPIEHDMVTRSIANAQVKVEGYNFDLRKHLLEYDDVVNQQRHLIYEQRRLILTSDTLRETVLDMVHEELRGLASAYLLGDVSEWDLHGLTSAVRKILPLPPDTMPPWDDASAAAIEQQLESWAEDLYSQKVRQLGADMRHLERLLMLTTVDSLWVRHLTALDELREGIGLRAVAQRDPLVEYKRDAFEMFDELKAAISSDVTRKIYFASLVRRPAQRPMRAYRPAPGGGASAPRPRDVAKVGRNDPCPCGSGRKYKNCCMRKQGGTRATDKTGKAPANARGGKRPRRRKR
jgi:preprotein translocase subunit SecA